MTTSNRLDYIVVPSYTLRSAQRPTSQTCAALDQAQSTYTTYLPTNPDLKIILSTGDNQNLGVTNARVMADYLISKGVPSSVLILEEISKDTFENLRESRKIIENLVLRESRGREYSQQHPPTPTICIIAYDLHMRRVRFLARRAGWEKWAHVTYIGPTGPAQSAYGWRALQTSSRVSISIYELLALLYEVIRGPFRSPL